MVAEELHRKRRGCLDRHDAVGGVGSLEDPRPAHLERERRARKRRSEVRLECVPKLLRGRDELAHTFWPVLLQAADRRRQEHRSRLEPELDRPSPDRVDQIPTSGEQTEPGPGHSVLVEPRDTDVGAELEGAWLAEHRWADARAARIVDDQHDPLRTRCGDDHVELVRGQCLVGHREARQDDRVDPRLVRERADERFRTDGVDEPSARECHRADDRRVRVPRRDADDDPARRHDDLHRGHESRCRAIDEKRIVLVRVAAEVLECELAEALAEHRRRELVVEEREVGLVGRERPLEPRQVDDGQPLLPPCPDHPPRLAQLRVVVPRVPNHLPALVREPTGHAVDSHTARDGPRSPGGERARHEDTSATDMADLPPERRDHPRLHDCSMRASSQPGNAHELDRTVEPALRVVELVKRYPTGTEALKGVSLEIAAGEFFGLLGPNGAGKSTLIHCVTGLARPTSGDVRVFGHDAVHRYREARLAVGLAPQDLNLDWFLTVEETLDYHGGYFGMARKDRRERAAELLDAFGLVAKRNDRTRTLSGGMKRRLVLARALMHRPRLLILDEPTAGVDVELRLELWHYVQRINAEGTTILLTTHYLEEAEQLCTRIAFINEGEIVAEGTGRELAERYGVASLEDAYLALVGRNELSRALADVS